MFEKILEKILLNYFGKYLTGFDKNNLKLGVWSGNVVIENMQLKPDVIANMELPLDIQHSMIGRLVIKVPWTKLSSAPVEVLIEDVLLVVKPKDPRNWNFSDEWKIQKKFNVLLNYAQEQMEKFLNKKKKKDAEDAGYFNKLTLKVLDNIQLQVKNIHLRWEANSGESPHAWGIRMDDLDAYTTNSEWNKFYIDRTDEKNKLAPMNKIVQVSNLRVYWNSVETSFFQQYTPPELLYQDIDEIININATFKLVQNVKSSFEQSLNEIFIDLEWIAITMKHAQLQQLILMMETISLYTKLLWVERKTVKAVQYDKQEYQDKFQSMFGYILRSEQKQISILSQEEQDRLNDILQSVEYDLLLEWVRSEVSSIILETKVQEMQKQKSKKGWFGWGATEITEDDDQEIREIQQFIDATLLENETQAISIIRPANSIRYTVKFVLYGASILLLKEYSDLGGSIDGLRLTLKDLRFEMESQQNTDWKSNFVLQDVELELMQKDGYLETQYTALCYVLERENVQTGFTTFSLQKFTASKTDTAATDLVIKCRVEPVTWIYNASLVRIFREMKKVKKGNIDEALKSATWERLERLQDGTQSKLQVLMASTLRIDLDIEVEKFRVLLPVEGGAGWQFYIERGQMRSCDQSSDDIYDRFVVQVKDASFVHGIAEGAVGRPQTTETFLVEKYSLDLEFSRLKSSIKMVVRSEDEDVPSLVVDLKLKKLKLSLTEKSYSDLVYLPEAIFPILNQNERLELMQEEKASIMSQSTKSGWLKRRGHHIRVWTRTYVVLSGAYLYFYDNETSMVASLTLYIKNSTIERLDSTLEEQEQHSFSIINRYDFSYLALESDKTLIEWMGVLNRKIEEFTTENQFLRRSSIKAQKNLTQAIRGPLVKLVGCMEKVELVMHKDNQSQLLHLMIEGLEFMWRRSSARQNYIISMKRLFVEDWVFQLACPANQTLILMEAVDKCLVLEIISTMPNHSEYNKIDMQVKCRIENILMNWKPDSLLQIREWFLIMKERKSRSGYYFYVKDYEVDALKQGKDVLPQDLRHRKLMDAMMESLQKCELYYESKINTRDEFHNLIDYESFIQNYDHIYQKVIQHALKKQSILKPQSIFVQFECSIQSAEFNFFQLQSHALHFRLRIEELALIFRKLSISSYADGFLKNLNLYDTTNYPHTIDSNLEWENIRPYELIGRRKDNTSSQLIRFRWAAYDNLILVSKNRNDMLLSVELSPTFITYQHQPIMRIIDYIMCQLIALLKEPEYLTMNAAYMEQKRKLERKDRDLKAKRVWGELEYVFKKFICPTFMDVRITLKKPLLIIKGWLHFQEYFQIDSEEIVIYNGSAMDNSRLLQRGGIRLLSNQRQYPKGFPDGLVEQAWTETYYIEAKQLQLWYIENEKETAFSQPFDFNLSFERVTSVNETQEVFPEVQYDTSLKIRSAMTSLILTAFREQYLQLCRLIFHNFQSDDLMDRHFIHDFEVVRSFAPSPISLYLDFQAFIILAMSQRNLQCPMAVVSLNKVRLEWLRHPDQNLELLLKAQGIGLFDFVKLDEMNYEERAFGGDLTQVFRHTIDSESTFYSRFLPQVKSEFHLYSFKEFNEEQLEFCLKFKILRPSGDKNIYIILNQIKLVVQPATLANVGLWSLLDQKCWPPQNEFGEMSNIKLFTEIRNSSLCFPSGEGGQMMATKGEISYIWNRLRMPNPITLIHMQEQGTLGNLFDGDDAYEHKVTLQDFELFKCERYDYHNLPTLAVPRRSVVMPFSLFLGIKNEIHITSGAQAQVYYHNKYECNFDKTVLKFSYKDLLVVMGIADYYVEQIKLIGREPSNEVLVEQPPPYDVNNYYDMIVHGLQVVLINDAGEAYVPVFDLTIYESQLIFHQTRVKSILSMVLIVSSMFYNPTIAIWEPIIERSSFALDMSLTAKSNPKKYIILEMNSPLEVLNINLSAQMVSVFHRTYLSWSKELRESKRTNARKQMMDELQEEERKEFVFNKSAKTTVGNSVYQSKLGDQSQADTVDHVSPYTIRNETGYVIEVEDDVKNDNMIRYVLQSGGCVNYQIDADLEKVFIKEEMSREQRLVRIWVKHPVYNFQSVGGIELDLLRNRQISLRAIDQNKTFNLIVEVVPKDTRKVLLVSSEVIVFNKTDQVIQLKLYEAEESLSIFIMVEQGRAYSLPLDCTRGFMVFRFQDDQQTNTYSQLIDLKLCADLSEKSYEFNHSGACYTLLRCVRRNFNQTMLYLEAPYTIKSCLPNSLIEFELFSDMNSPKKKNELLDYDSESQFEESNLEISNLDALQYTKQPYFNLQTIQRGTLGKQEEMQVHSVSQNRRLALKIKIAMYQWSDTAILYNPYAKVYTKDASTVSADKVVMCDFRGNTGQVDIHMNNNLITSSSRSFYLHTPCFVVNDTQEKLFFYSNINNNNRNLKLCAGQQLKDIEIGQSQITYINNLSTTIQLSLFDDLSNISTVISLNQTGNDKLMLPNDKSLLELGTNISLVCVDQIEQLFTKVLTVSPRYVFVNFTQYVLSIIQENNQAQVLSIPSQQRRTLNWTKADQPKLVRAKIHENNLNWGYSQPLDPKSTGFTCFVLRSDRNRSSTRYLNCQQRQEEQIIYLIFQECKVQKNDDPQDVSEVPYLIVNQLKDITLVCYQSCMTANSKLLDQEYKFQEFKVIIYQFEQNPFAWEFPMEKKEITVELRFEGELNGLFEQEPLVIALDDKDLDNEEITLWSEQNQLELKFYVKTEWEGSSKKLTLFQEEGFIQRQREQDVVELQLGISINQIGLSVMDRDHAGRRVELLYLTLKNVDFILLETKALRTSQLKIKYINIDNNSSNSTMFPVIMTPTKYKEIFEFDRPHLSLIIAQSTQVQSLTLIKSIRACLLPTTVSLTSEVLEQLYALFKSLETQFQSNISYDGATQQRDFEYALEFYSQQEDKTDKRVLRSRAPIFYNNNNQVQMKYGHSQLGSPVPQAQENDIVMNWEVEQLPLQAKTTYIDRIEIYPLNITLTFYNSVGLQNINYGSILQLAMRIGIIMGNIDMAPIQLQGIYLENCFDTSSGITKKLISHYKDNLIQQLISILGSIEILGNPVGLIKHIVIGVYDLFDKPIEGFIKGPIEGGIGIAKGVGSLIKNTVSGVSNFFGKFTGTCAGLLSYASMDPIYQSRREILRTARPRQILDGVSQGFHLFAYSVERGVVGVFWMPVEGVRRRGSRGAILGGLKGIGGLIIKPLAGICDQVSKSFDGIKATAMYWDDKPNEKRERDIRVMYSIDQFYKGYNIKDAQIIQLLYSQWKGQCPQINLFDAFYLESRVEILILSYQCVIFADIRRKKLIWVIDGKLLQNVTQSPQGIIFTFLSYQSKILGKEVTIKCIDSNLRTQIFEKSQWLIQTIQNN